MNSHHAPAVVPRKPRLARLLRPLVSSRVFDFWASHVRPTWSLDRPLARIVARQQESSDAVTLWLAPNRHWAGFRPGQHINISAEIDGARVTRSYSLSGARRRGRRIAITVKRMPGGKLSGHLCDTAAVGDVLDLGQAFGEMTLPQDMAGSWLFLAGGSGITPMMAMIRALAEQGMPVPLTLLYSARTRAELCFVDTLRALAAAHANFRVRFVLTREADAPGADDEHAGRINADLIAAQLPDPAQGHVYACGPGAFVDHARDLLATTAASFRSEAFTPPLRVVADGGTVEVTLARSGRTLTVPRGTTLLTALEAEGLRPASGCRIGICNTCSCGKSSGTTRQVNTGDLAVEPASALKLCVNSAVTDLVIDL